MFPAEVRILCYRIAAEHHMSPEYAGRERTNSTYTRNCKSSVQAYICTENFNPRNILSEYGSEERGKSFDAVFTILLWMLRYRSRRKFSARCLLFASKLCDTGVEKVFQKVRNKMSFFDLPCCCKGMKRPSRYRLPLPENRTLQNSFKKFENKCRFGGSKVAVGVWEEIL